MSRQQDRDAADLAQFGYAQQLLREMGGFANFAVSFSIISILTGAVALFGQGLGFAGPASIGFGWPIVSVFTLCVAMSLAEIASAMPTAGAMYHWSSLLGGPGWGWFTAWFNLIGQIATTAGINYGLAQFIADLLGWQGRLPVLELYALLLLSQALINHYGIKLVARINDVSVWYHIVVTLGVAVGMFFFARAQPVSFAFKTGYTTSGYNYGWAFLLGFLLTQWTLTGYDASAHVTEETVDPRRNAPWGMVNAVWLSGAIGWLMMLAMTLAIKDLPAAAAAPNAFLYVCEQALGGKLGRAVVWTILPAMWFCGVASVTTNARMIFAFARDGGLPRSDLWRAVSKEHRTPANAIWLSAGLALLVALYAGAFGVVVTLSTIGLYVSYVIPIFLWLRARRAKKRPALGPWHLGKWGGAINAVAVAWVAFISVLFVAPPNQLTGYTFAGLLALLAAIYRVKVRGAFRGPKLAAEAVPA